MSETVSNDTPLNIRPGPALSRAEWNAVVAANTGGAARRAPGAFEHTQLDAQTGLEVHKTGLSEEEMERSSKGFPPNPALYPMGALNGIGRYAATNEREATWALYADFARKLLDRGPEAVRLMRDAGLAGMQKEEESREPGAISGEYRGFTVVAPTRGEAQISRGLVDFAMESMRPDNTRDRPKPMNTVEDLPPAERVQQFLTAIRPQQSLEHGVDAAHPNGRQLVALVVSSGSKGQSYDPQAEAIRFIKDRPSLSNALFLVPDNRRFSESLRRNGIDVLDGPLAARMQMPDGLKGKEWATAREERVQASLHVADRAVVLFKPSGYARDAVGEAAVKAAALGKLIGYAEDRNGQMEALPIRDADRRLASDHTQQDKTRVIEAIRRIDQPLDSAQGRMALRLIANTARDGFSAASQADAAATLRAATTRGITTVRELTEAAQDPAEGRAAVDHDGVPQSLRSAGMPVSMLRRFQEGRLVRDMLGNAEIHAAQLQSKDCHEVAGSQIGRNDVVSVFVQGNQALLERDTIALVGSLPASNLAKQISETVGKNDRTALFVEGYGAPTSPDQVPPGAVLVARSGASFHREIPDLAWSPEPGSGAFAEKQIEGTKKHELVEYVWQARNLTDTQRQAVIKDQDRNNDEKRDALFQPAATGEFKGQFGGTPRTTEVIQRKTISVRKTPDSFTAKGPTGTYRLLFDERCDGSPADHEPTMQLHFTPTGKTEAEQTRIAIVTELSPRYSRGMSDKDREFSQLEWDRAASTLRIRASVHAEQELSKASPEAQAQQAVRNEFGKNGAVVYMTPPTTDSYQWNSELRAYRPITSDAQQGRDQAALEFGVKQSARVLVVQESNDRDSRFGPMLKMVAETGGAMPIAVWPTKDMAPDTFLGNGAIVRTPADQLIKKIPSLNADAAAVIAKNWENQKAPAILADAQGETQLKRLLNGSNGRSNALELG